MTGTESLDINAPEPEKSGEGGFWGKLKKGLTMTHTELLEKLEAVATGQGPLNADALDDLEETLISADLGVEASLELVESISSDVKEGRIRDSWKLRERLTDEVSVLLLDAPRPVEWDSLPEVTLVVGVNGVGKTTSIAKLAHRYQARGESVLLGAADTFRAAAIEQLGVWGERLDVPVISGQAGGDPGAVVYDAAKAAKARRVDHLLIDTAGRLHTKDHLMAELGKVRRILEREAEDRSLRTLLVVDATTGHNAIQQARQFMEVAALDGILLAKIDGTAKGGMAVAIARDLRVPVLYLGVGEGVGDLIDFRPREFAAALLGGD